MEEVTVVLPEQWGTPVIFLQCLGSSGKQGKAAGCILQHSSVRRVSDVTCEGVTGLESCCNMASPSSQPQQHSTANTHGSFAAWADIPLPPAPSTALWLP